MRGDDPKAACPGKTDWLGDPKAELPKDEAPKAGRPNAGCPNAGPPKDIVKRRRVGLSPKLVEPLKDALLWIVEVTGVDGRGEGVVGSGGDSIVMFGRWNEAPLT